MRRTRDVMLSVVLVLGLAAFGDASQSGRVLWLWQGIPTTDAITIKVASSVEQGAVLQLSVPSQGTREIQGVPTPAPSKKGSPRSVTTFVLSGLNADTDYTFRVSAGSGPPVSGRFRTAHPSPRDLTVAFASCAKKDHEVFSSIAALNPGLFIHMGDLHYENIGTNIEHKTDDQLTPLERETLSMAFASAFDKSFGRHQRQLFSAVPVAYVWDDHDYGPNNSGASAPTRRTAREAYRIHVPGNVGPNTIHQVFDRGSVRFLFTDNRSDRSRPSATEPTMLGAEQRQWLLGELQRAASDNVMLLVWVNPVPWITNERASDDTWAGYSRERTEIAAEMERLGLAKRTVILSGDAHMLGIGERKVSNYSAGEVGKEGGPLVLQAGPLNNTRSVKGGPYLVNTKRTWLFRKQQFGLLKFRFDDEGVTMEFSGLRHRGGARSEPVNPPIAATMRCDTTGCRVDGES